MREKGKQLPTSIPPPLPPQDPLSLSPPPPFQRRRVVRGCNSGVLICCRCLVRGLVICHCMRVCARGRYRLQPGRHTPRIRFRMHLSSWSGTSRRSSHHSRRSSHQSRGSSHRIFDLSLSLSPNLAPADTAPTSSAVEHSRGGGTLVC